MKSKFILLFTLFFLLFGKLFGQECLSGSCSNLTNQYPTTTFSTSSSSWTTVSTTMNAGNWTLFSVTSGNRYEWTYCSTYGGISNWDAQLTLSNYSGGAILCYSDDVCGNAPYISWQATFTGTVRLLTSKFNCVSNTGSPYNKLVWRRSAPDLNITVNNISNNPVNNAEVKLYNSSWTLLQTLNTNSSGLVTFAGLSNASYNFEIHYTPTGVSPPITPYKEFWGTGTATISGSSVSTTFTRNQPHIFFAPTFSSTSLNVWQNTTGYFTVKNPLPYSTSSYVKIYVDRDNTSSWDYINTASPFTISNNSTRQYNFDISPQNTGTYKFYAFVYSEVNSSYIITDQYAWTSAFTSNCASLPQPTSLSPGTASTPGTITNTLTPTLSWSGSSSGVYHVQIWDAATSPATDNNVIYGYMSPSNSPGHCISGLSHTIPSGVLSNNGQYKWSVHRNDPCEECESTHPTPVYFQVQTCSVPNNVATCTTSIGSPANGTEHHTNLSCSTVSGADGYNFEWSSNGTTWYLLAEGTSSSYDVNNSDNPNLGYYYRARAYKCTPKVYSTNYTYASPQPIYTACDDPALPILNNATSSTLNITIATETPIANPATTTYAIYCTNNGYYVQSDGTLGVNAFFQTKSAWGTKTIIGLTSNIQYCFYIKAKNSNTTPDIRFNVSNTACLSTGCIGLSNISIPSNLSVNNGGSTTISVSFTGSTPTYQWQVSSNNGANFSNLSNSGIYSGTNSQSLFISTISNSINGNKYRCILTNCFGTYTANSATLSVIATPPVAPINITPTQTAVLIKDPINIGTKSYLYSYSDLSIPVVGGKLTFSHLYNSINSAIDGPLGFGWSHSFNIYITNYNDTLWRVSYPDGHSKDFIPVYNGNGSSFPLYGGTTDSLYKTGSGYTLTTKEQNIYQFNLIGRLYSISNPNSNVISFHYTGNLLDSIRGPGGRYFVITGNTTTGKISTVSSNSGKSCLFRIDGAGNLVCASNPNNDSIHFTYNSSHEFISFVNALGDTVITNVYSSNKITGQFDAYRNFTDISYDNPSLGYTTVTYPDSTKDIFYFNSFGVLTSKTNALNKSSIFNYDENFNPDTIYNEKSQQTLVQYDKFGNPIIQTLPGNRTLRGQFNGFQKPTTITNALGSQINFEYEPGSGNLKSVFFPDTSVRKFDYNINGTMKFSIDGVGDSTYYYYNSFGDLIKIGTPTGNRFYGYDTDGRLDSTTDENGNLTILFYDNYGNVIQIKDALNQSQYYAYDKDNQQISFTNKRGFTTYFYYNKKGLKIAQKDALLGIDSFYYDKQDRLIKWVNAIGNTIIYGYDAKGRRTTVSNTFGTTKIDYDDIDNPTKITDANNHELTFGYNTANTLNSITDSLQHTNTTSYDLNGNAISTTNYKGYVKTFTYDSLNSLSKVIDVENETTIFQRDKNGNLISLTDGNGHIQTFVRGKSNRLTSYKDGAQNTYTFTQDSVGNPKTITKPVGTISYQFDKLNRLTKQTNSTGDIYNRTYDQNDNLISINSNIGTSQFYYDQLDRMYKYIDPFGKQVSFGFNAIGSISYIVYSGVDTVKYTYDGANRLWKVTDWKNNVFTYTYDATGKIVRLLYPTGIHCDYTYDATNRLLSRISYYPSNSILYGQTFTYYNDSTVELRYGNADLGLSSTRRSYQYRDDDAILSDSIRMFSNDNNGNRIRESFNGDTIRYTYSVDQLLTSNQKQGVLTTYRYDGLGHRLERNVGQDTTRFVLNLNSPISFVLQNTDGNGAIKANYIYGNGLLESIDNNDSIFYYHFDASHNTIAVTDLKDSIKAKYTYSSFGSLLVKTGTLIQPFTFLGEFGVEQETDSCYYIRARYYDASTGRFLSKDPLFGDQFNPQSLNRYIYSLNSPLNTFDYTGLTGNKDGDGSTLSAPSTNLWDQYTNGLYNFSIGFDYGIYNGLTLDFLKPGNIENVEYMYSGSYSTGYKIGGLISLGAQIASITGSLSKEVAVKGVQFTKSNLQIGQKMHAAYKAGQADGVRTFKEFVLPSGRRIDFLDIENGIIYELKPFNPRQIIQGEKQLFEYMDELKTIKEFKNIQWKRVLEFY